MALPGVLRQIFEWQVPADELAHAVMMGDDWVLRDPPLDTRPPRRRFRHNRRG